MRMIDFSAFHKLSYGLYLICSEYEGQKSGYAGNTGFQVTSSPSVIAISCSKENFTCEIIRKRKAFSLSVLQKELDVTLIGDFGFKSGREFNKFERHPFKTNSLGIPVITESTVAAFECNVINEVDCGSHILFIGEVISAEKINDASPLTYEYYHEHYKMYSPKNAPTYIKPELLIKKQTEPVIPAGKSAEYVCTICGYTYNPEDGDPVAGIPPGTPFEELPDDYVCPICRAGKSFFIEA
jgi:flavin reductase (DIM6/NTAB) family NADH-FMN oxidoreductase RutF/rubredoxin